MPRHYKPYCQNGWHMHHWSFPYECRHPCFCSCPASPGRAFYRSVSSVCSSLCIPLFTLHKGSGRVKSFVSLMQPYIQKQQTPIGLLLSCTLTYFYLDTTFSFAAKAASVRRRSLSKTGFKYCPV